MTEDDRAACTQEHDPDELDAEWRWWPVNLDGFVDPETSYVFGDAAGPDDTMGAQNVERLLHDLHGCYGPVVVREVATGELWTLDELRVNYPGAVLHVERMMAVEERKRLEEYLQVMAKLNMTPARTSR